MLQAAYLMLNNLLGLHLSADKLGTFHLIARISVVYFMGIILVRLQRQFMALHTPFNYILNFVLGSVLAAAIIGETPYFPVLGMTLFIFGLNFIISLLVYCSKTFESLIKGDSVVLVNEGKIQQKGMRRHLITKEELLDAIRSLNNDDDLNKIEKAYFESTGEITIVVKDSHHKKNAN